MMPSPNDYEAQVGTNQTNCTVIKTQLISQLHFFKRHLDLLQGHRHSISEYLNAPLDPQPTSIAYRTMP